MKPRCVLTHAVRIKPPTYDTSLVGTLKSQNVPRAHKSQSVCWSWRYPDVLRDAFPQAWGFDKYVEYESPNRTFYVQRDVEMIVTNPFNLATEFIEHTMTLTETAWFLLPLDYLCSRGRYERVYHNPNFHCSTVRVFSRSPTMKQEKVKTDDSESGKMSYAGIVSNAVAVAFLGLFL